MASNWRDAQAASQNKTVMDSVAEWQGCPEAFVKTYKKLSEAGLLTDATYHVAVMWNALENAPSLPIGTVIWHATAPGKEPDSSMWLATSATMEGSEAWAKDNLPGGKCTLHKLVVATDGVRAIGAGSDDFYEYEKEIIVRQDFGHDPTEEKMRSPSGNEIVVSNLFSE